MGIYEPLSTTIFPMTGRTTRRDNSATTKGRSWSSLADDEHWRPNGGSDTTKSTDAPQPSLDGQCKSTSKPCRGAKLDRPTEDATQLRIVADAADFFAARMTTTLGVLCLPLVLPRRLLDGSCCHGGCRRFVFDKQRDLVIGNLRLGNLLDNMSERPPGIKTKYLPFQVLVGIAREWHKP